MFWFWSRLSCLFQGVTVLNESLCILYTMWTEWPIDMITTTKLFKRVSQKLYYMIIIVNLFLPSPNDIVQFTCTDILIFAVNHFFRLILHYVIIFLNMWYHRFWFLAYYYFYLNWWVCLRLMPQDKIRKDFSWVVVLTHIFF